MENPYAENPYAEPPAQQPVNPYAPPQAQVATPSSVDGFDFYTVGPLKFSLMSVSTLGLFVVYWFYKNWNHIRLRENESIWPFWRAFFTILWTFSMGRRFHDYAAARGFTLDFPHVACGLAFFIANVVSRADSLLGLLSFFAFLAILPFDYAARRLNGNGELAAPTMGRFSALNVVWILVGSLFFVLVIIGIFVAGPQV